MTNQLSAKQEWLFARARKVIEIAGRKAENDRLEGRVKDYRVCRAIAEISLHPKYCNRPNNPNTIIALGNWIPICFRVRRIFERMGIVVEFWDRVGGGFAACSRCNGVITSAAHHTYAAFLREDYETWCLSCITKEPQIYVEALECSSCRKDCLSHYRWDYLRFDFSKCGYELFRKGKSYPSYPVDFYDNPPNHLLDELVDNHPEGFIFQYAGRQDGRTYVRVWVKRGSQLRKVHFDNPKATCVGQRKSTRIEHVNCKRCLKLALKLPDYIIDDFQKYDIKQKLEEME